MRINKNLVFVSLLFLAILVSYENIFQNDFAWDDFFFIVENTHIRNTEEIPSFFTQPSAGNLYRPVRSIFYTITYQIWELNAFGYHLNGFILHFLVTVLIFFITLRLTKKNIFSFVVALFFAVHPIHTARVTNMTASFDMYGILFLLLSVFFYILNSQLKKKNYRYLSILFYLLAIFSSEEALTLVLILFLYDFSFNYSINAKNARLLLKKYVPFIVITAFYMIIRFAVVQKIGRGEFYFEHSLIGTWITTIKVFVQYIIILLFPVNLSIERYVKFETAIFSFSFLASLAALIFILFFFIRCYGRSKLAFFSIGFFFIALLPFSNILPQFTIFADRYLYLPSYGFVLLLTVILFQVRKIDFLKNHSKIAIIILVLLITLPYAFLTIQRNAEWKDNTALLSADIKKNPLGTRLHQAVALEYRDKGDYENAEMFASRAVELASGNYNAYENLGTINAYVGKYNDAIRYYNSALELNPDFYLANNNLGLVYSYMGDLNTSIFYLKRAIEIDPKLSKAHNDLGTVYAQMGEFELAIREMEKSIEINPYDADYYYNLAIIHELLENKDRADELLLRGLEIEPDNEKIKSRLDELKQ